MSKDDLSKITIVRTSDAERMQFHVALSGTTLSAFKEMITTSDFTTNNTEPIRVFHLGRELKSGGRSLETLGIGRFRNFIVHVHVAAGVVRRSNEQQRASRKRTPVAAAAVMDKQQPVVVVDLLHDSDDEVAVVAPTATASKRPRVL